ncbi:uncharacterized protein Dmoj_GI26404 [Drosophila mojavensis]|uniref:Uncharacterized protein n=1 Tax=Drosophila mojavensis TaxID=7230 RepID=A0A0Q9XAI6_DROMO|nr:uncharacterized protein Dmoj_GI26404 [Drosophila mojavensis]
MIKGCPCKSATNTDPNCSYCANGKQNSGKQNKGGSYDPNGYPNSKNGGPHDGSNNPSNQKGKSGARGNDSQGGDGSENSMSLLKAVLVFSIGCFLTMQMTNVANELG